MVKKHTITLDGEEVIFIKDAADMLGIKPVGVYAAIARGDIEAVKVSNLQFLNLESVKRYKNAERKLGRPAAEQYEHGDEILLDWLEDGIKPVPGEYYWLLNEDELLEAINVRDASYTMDSDDMIHIIENDCDSLLFGTLDGNIFTVVHDMTKLAKQVHRAGGGVVGVTLTE